MNSMAKYGCEADIGGAGLVDLRDAGMLESAERLRFALEPFEHLPAGQASPDDFQRDPTAGGLLLGLVHRPHAAFAKDADDAIASDLLRHVRTDAGGHGRDRPEPGPDR